MTTHGILGQNTDYPKTYSPHILYPIARSVGRQHLSLPNQQFIGFDYWHIFELSWLNRQGISQVATARLAVSADSPFIVESKSLKLYLNSLNFSEFDSSWHIKKTIETDLSKALQSAVKLDIFALTKDALPIGDIDGVCIDNALDSSQKITILDDVNPNFLTQSSSQTDDISVQHFYSNLLRSNCPVTNQPDWGTVEIAIESRAVDTGDLLQYILSFRNHNGFHEQCVEQIFSDLSVAFNPKSLMVRAFYTRRGGIDINPVRVSDVALLPTPLRLCRQ